DAIALHQAGIDLDWRNLSAAADDQVLFPPGQRQKAVAVERADIAGAEAAAGMDSHCAVLVQITERMVGPAAEFDKAEFARRQAAAVIGDNGEIMIRQRPADRAKPALFAGNGGNPIGFAGAVALRDADPELCFEALPLVEQQGGRARRDESQL